MPNLIKMDLYRLFKTNSIKVGLLISAVFSAVIILGIAGITLLCKSAPEETMELAMFFESFIAWGEEVSIFEIMFTSLTKFSLLMVCILTALYVSEEQISGYVKNIAGQVRSKGMMIYSKLVAIAVLVLLVFLAYCLGAAIVGIFFFHKSINFDHMLPFLAAFFVKWILYVAVGAIILFLCTLTKNKSLAIAIGVIFGSGITTIAYSVIELVGMFILSIDLSISSIMPDGLISSITMESSAFTFGKGIFGAIAYIVIFLLLSSFIMKKRDTR